MPTRATARRALTEHKTVSPNIPKSYLNTRSNSLKKNNSTKQASHAMSKAVMNIYQDQPEIKQQNLKKRSMTNPENIDPENVKIPVRNSSHRQAVKNLAVPTETRLKSPARAMLPKSPQKSFSSTATQTENFVVPKKLENTKSQELDDLLLNENPENVKFWKNKFDTLEKLNKSLNSSYNELEINFKKEVDMNQKQKEVKVRVGRG